MSLSLIRSTTVKIVAAIAQLVERIHGKDEVTGSSPVRGSIFVVFKVLYLIILLIYDII